MSDESEYTRLNNQLPVVSSGFNFREFFSCSGSALLMCIAYLDPGNLESNLQAANLTGNKLLWILLWSHFLGLLIQNLSSRLGLKSQLGLAGLINKKYNRRMSLFLWFNIELAIIGSDIQEIIGTSIALNVLFNLPIRYGVFTTFLGTGVFILLSSYGIRLIELFFALLLSVMALCFLSEVFISKPDLLSVIEGVAFPRIPKGAYLQATAMIGAIIMPHNIYLHSALISKKLKKFKISAIPLKRLKNYFLLESGVALIVSLFINVCVYVVFAKVFYYDNNSIPTQNVSLGMASRGLLNSLKSAAVYLWGLGLLAAGQSSTITGTISGQLVMDGFFNLKIPTWLRALITRSIALVPSTLVACYAENKMDMLGQILNVFQSLQLPLTLVPLIQITCDKEIMQELSNSNSAVFVYKMIVVFIILINLVLVYWVSKELSSILVIALLLISLLYVASVVSLYKNYR